MPPPPRPPPPSPPLPLRSTCSCLIPPPLAFLPTINNDNDPTPQGLWVGRRVPEVDEHGVPILYPRYARVEEVLLADGGAAAPVAAANGSGKKAAKRRHAEAESDSSSDSEPESPSEEEEDSSDDEEEEQQQQQQQAAKKSKQAANGAAANKKQKQQQQESSEEEDDSSSSSSDDGDGSDDSDDSSSSDDDDGDAKAAAAAAAPQRKGNADEARQIRSVLGFDSAPAPVPAAAAKPAAAAAAASGGANGAFAFSFDAQVKAQVEAETDAKLARLHAIDSADKDGYVPRRVFVGGMPYAYSREQVEEYWAYCGPIESLDLLTFPDSGRFRGIAFITYATQEGYEAALACDGEQLDGQTLKVDRCKAAAAAPKRGGGGGAYNNAAPTTPAAAAAAADEPAAPARKQQQQQQPAAAAASGAPLGKAPGYNVAYVGNIAFEATREEVAALFDGCGVKLVRLHTDQHTGRSKGYAHVHFDDEAGLDAAVARDGAVLRGRGVRVSYGQPKK